MAYYITDDGRVHEIDVDVKNDGTVRPQRYSEFTTSDIILDKTKKSASDYNLYYRPLIVSNVNQIDKKAIKKLPSKKQKKPGEISKSQRKKLNKEKREKFIKENIISKINIIIQESQLSEEGLVFVHNTIEKLSFVRITDDLKDKIISKGLATELDKIIVAISKINVILTISKTAPEAISSIQPKGKTSKSKSIKKQSVKGVISTSEGRNNTNTWTTGNYVRKGPAPKYGYARDRFGRIQERDSYREDCEVNPYNTNSNHDFEDDNSSLDILD